jgi:hypothetical protein
MLQHFRVALTCGLNLRAPVLPRLGVAPLQRSRIAAPTLKKNQARIAPSPILTRRAGYIRPCGYPLISLPCRLARHARSRRGEEQPPAPSGMRSSAVASQDHQHSVIRRRRKKTRHCACEVRGPPRGRARPYSCFVLEHRNSAIMLPKLYIVPLDELLGILHRGLIVGAHKSNCAADKTVFVHDVSSILGHIGVTPNHCGPHQSRAVCPVPVSETLMFGLAEPRRSSCCVAQKR